MNPVKPILSFPDLKLVETSISAGKCLPRWETNGAVYHISLHLADSVPAEQRRLWREDRQRLTMLSQRENRPLSDAELAELRTLFDERIERYLVSGHGACLLKEDVAAQALEQTITYSDGTFYALHEWTIMPNHLHVIVGGFGGESPMHDILAIWKRVSSHRINKVLGRTGAVWHDDAYTRIIRNEDEYRRQLSYVWNNPENAGITSGFRRRKYVEIG